MCAISSGVPASCTGQAGKTDDDSANSGRDNVSAPGMVLFNTPTTLNLSLVTEFQGEPARPYCRRSSSEMQMSGQTAGGSDPVQSLIQGDLPPADRSQPSSRRAPGQCADDRQQTTNPLACKIRANHANPESADASGPKNSASQAGRRSRHRRECGSRIVGRSACLQAAAAPRPTRLGKASRIVGLASATRAVQAMAGSGLKPRLRHPTDTRWSNGSTAACS